MKLEQEGWTLSSNVQSDRINYMSQLFRKLYEVDLESNQNLVRKAYYFEYNTAVHST